MAGIGRDFAGKIAVESPLPQGERELESCPTNTDSAKSGRQKRGEGEEERRERKERG
jgi:hypothetical protein